jgi:hypothetical protein
MLRTRIVWSLRYQCIALAIAPVAIWLGVFEYRHQQNVQLVREMNRAALREAASLNIEQEISSLKQLVEMNLATPLLNEIERQAEVEILKQSLARANCLRKRAQEDREQYSCAHGR